jgi:alpha-tubulin suppressor-like RCC1 family protein
VYDIGTLTSDITIEKQGEYASLTFDTSSNVAYFSNVTVGAIASTMAGYEKQDQVLDAGTNAGYSNGDAAQGGYGNSIDMSADGTRMVVGNAHYTDSNGRVWLYHLESGSWVLKQTWDGGTRLGSQVAMNEAGTRAFALYTGGGVKIWDYTSGAWDTSASGTYVITPGTISGEVPGVDCNKAGDVVIIGSGNSTNTWIYRLSGGSWSSEKNFSRRGSGVAMNGAGTRCFMGDRSSHKVWESNYSGGSWGTETEIIEESSHANYWPIAMRVDSAGETLCVHGNHTGSPGKLYERAGNGSWSASVSDIRSNNEIYGSDPPKISYDGTLALFHSYYNNVGSDYYGRFTLYSKSGSTWSILKTINDPNEDSNDYFGDGAGLAKTSKDRFVISAPGDDVAGTNYGSIYTYSSAIPDFISFDTYNKLSLSGITNPTSKLHVLPTGAESTTTYDIGTATNIYIESAGTYTVAMKGSDGFALDSSVVGTVTPLPTTNLDIPGFPTNSAPPRTSIPYTNSISQTNYTGGKYTLTYNGDVYEITVDSEEQGGATYDPVTSVFARGWHLFTKIITSEGSGGGTTTNYAQYNSANYVTVPAHVKIKLPSAKVAVGGFLRESRNNHITGFIIQGSNDDSTWTDLYTGTTVGITTGVTFTFSNSTAYQYYRLRVTSLSTPDANTYFRLDEWNIHFFGYVAPPSLNFDTYNKLTFTNADTDSTYKLKYESNTYDLGTISNVYIAYPGTYSAEIKGATNFALSSNTATYQSPFPWEIYNATNSELFTSWTQTDGLIDLSGYTGTDILVLVPKEGLQQNTDWHVKWTFDFTDLSGAMLTTISTYGNRYTVNGDLLYGDLRNDSKGDMSIATTGTSTQLLAPYPQVTHTVLDTNLGNGVYRRTIEYIKEGDNFTFKMNGAEYTDANNPYTMQRTNGLINIRSGTYTGENLLYPNIRINGTNLELSNIKVNIYTGYYGEEPKLTHDGYNKLSIQNITPTATTLKYGSNTYDIGTSTSIYIENDGTYEIETKDVNTFALASNTATYQVHPNATYSNYRSIGGISAASSSLHNEDITTTYSVTMWAKKINGNYFFRTTPTDGNSAPYSTHGILRWNGGKISHVTWTSNSSTGIKYTTTLDATSKDEWHFYGFEFEGTTTKLHLDGAAPITGTTGLNGQTHNRIRFDDPTVFSTGGARLAEFAVYNRALTDAEFVSIYNNGKPNGPDNVSSGRVSWFKCLSGAMATNSGSGGDFDATITEDTDVPSTWLDPTPSLTHDGYKLVVSGITPTSTTLKYGSNTYEIGTATNIYVENTGAYTAEIGGAADFAFTNTTVSGTIKTVEPVITGGYQFGHALTYDGKLYGWGENSNGELGVGDTTDKTVPTLCTGIPQGEIVSIWKQSIRGQSRWAKTRDGRIWVTGDHDSYCLPGSSSDFTTFTDVSAEFGDYTQTSNNVVWASGSERATQVLMENGDVWSFGDDTSSLGVLGQGASPTSDRTPRKLNVSNITKITYGGDLVLALDSSNVIWMWGRNEVGNSTLGWGPYNVPTNIMSTGTNSLTSLLATDSETVVDIESSYYSMFALTDKGTVYCTGHNASGQLGQGNATAKTSSDGWVKIEYFTSNAITVNKLYVGGGNPHVFADTSDGWYCWGENTTGELGLGDNTDKLSPVKFTGVSNIKKFGVGYLVSYAITEDGKYYAWGRGTNYARGDNTTGDISYPKYISQLPNILAPSFEFDGYDKVLAHMKPTSYVYEFFIAVVVGAVSENNELWLQEISSSGVSFTSSMMVMNTQYKVNGTDYSAGTSVVGGLFDGSTGTSNRVGVYPGYHDLNQKIFTLTTTQELTNITFVSQRPKYMPGWKIVLNGTTILEDSANNGTSGSPDPFSITKTLPPMSSSLTKYTKDTHTYDTNQAQIVTISDPGTYDAQIKSGTDFSLKSATIPATKTSGLYTWAFHHGNFDNAYGDGDILTARDNGRFYADTPIYTGTIGTITPVNPFGTTQPTLVSSLTITNGKALNTLSYSSYVHRSTDTTNTRYVYALGALSTDTKYDIAYNWVTKKWLDIDSDATHNTFGTSASDTSNTSRISTENPQTVYVMETYWNLLFAIFTNPYYQESLSKTTYTFTPASTLTANVLMVAGGGGGGGRYGCGGGGAGGLVYTAGTSLASGVTKTIVVGNGDSGGNGNSQKGYNGKDTTFTDLDNAIGGGGGAGPRSSGLNGGSGGGGGGASAGDPGGVGGSGTTNQGNSGGAGSSTNGGSGAGGGGSGSVGIDGTSTVGGSGGNGKFFGKGSSYTDFGDEYGEGGYFAGGGGGGTSSSATNTPGTPGRGGGGYGATYYGYMGINDSSYGGSQHALPHTGGGGGGSGTVDRDKHPGYASTGDGGVLGHGGRGGSGIVLLQTNVALPNGANTAVVQVGNPRRRSLPPTVDAMGSEVNRFSIIDSASMPTYKLPTHWYVDPVGSNNDRQNDDSSSIGQYTIQTRADGGTSNVWYQISYNYFALVGNKMAQSADAIFMPVEQQSYDVLLSIGSNGNNDISFEMNADGTASLRRNVYTTSQVEIAGGSIVCFEAGKWHHIALTVDSGGNAVGYVNGYPVVSGTYTSVAAVGSRSGNFHFRCGVSDVTFRKHLTYEVSTYNFHMSPKQVLQRAVEVGLGPKLEYDGLNAINVVNIEKDSEITIYESNVNDTSNLYVVACNTSSYLLSNAGTYYAQIKGTDTFTITRPLTVSGTFPLYQYPPVATGTLSNGNFDTSAGFGNQSYFTVSGAETGNGTYSSYSSVAANSPGGTPADSSSVFTNGIGVDTITYTNEHYNFFQTSSLSNIDLVVILPSAKTIRKYVLYPKDDNAPTSPYEPGSSVNPMLEGNGSQDYLRRPKSWTLYGYTESTGWVSLDTVTNQPPSIYGDVHSISSPASYDQYKLSISENNGSTEATLLGEWQLWGDA